MTVTGDIFTSPIDYALQKTIESFEDKEDDNSKMIYESLIRSRAMWENIRINGLGICGMTYEEFCQQLEKKKNVIFLSDEEVEEFNKALRVMKVMRE